MHMIHLNQRNQILFQYLRDKNKKKKERKKGAKKKRVKIHPFHLPWIGACCASGIVRQTDFCWTMPTNSKLFFVVLRVEKILARAT